MIIPPDFELLAITRARHIAPGTKVAVERPATLPDSFVRISAAGGEGVRQIVICTARLAVEVWASNQMQASLTARRLAAGFNDPEWGDVYSCEATTPASYPDPDTRTPRYVFTIDVSARGQAS